MLQPARSKAGGRPRPLPPLLLPLLLALLPLSCASVNGSSAAPASSATAPLAPFHSVVSCLPFSLLIRPSSAPAAAANTSRVAESDGGSAAGGGTAPATTPSPAYTLRLDASDANITGAFEYSVSPDGTLHLSLSTPIATNSCASAIVELPADALREVRRWSVQLFAELLSVVHGLLVSQSCLSVLNHLMPHCPAPSASTDGCRLPPCPLAFPPTGHCTGASHHGRPLWLRL